MIKYFFGTEVAYFFYFKVIQGEGPDITIGEEFSCDPIILTYHRHLHGLGEHYNSVSPLL